MRKFSLAVLIALALVLVAPAAVAQELVIDPATIGTQFLGGVHGGIIDIQGLSNLTGDSADCVCPAQSGLCTPRANFDVNSTVNFNTYFDDLSTGGPQAYFFSWGFQLDFANVIVISDAIVTFDLSSIAPGEDFNGCIFFPVAVPNLWGGRTIPYGASVYGGLDRVQGRLGVLQATISQPPPLP